MARTRHTNVLTASRLQLLFIGSILCAGIHAFAPSYRIGYRHHFSTSTCTSRVPRISAKRQQTWLQSAPVAPANIPPVPIIKKPYVSASALVVLDIFFRYLFETLRISFPSSLAGCAVLLALLLTLPFGDKMYDALSPGSNLLAKWLPVFFVPSLVVLPLADGLGSALEFGKVALVVVGGFYFTLVTTAFSVLAVRDILQKNNNKLPASPPPLEEITEDNVANTSNDDDIATVVSKEDKVSASKPFSDLLMKELRIFTAASGISATAAHRITALAPMETPLTTAFLLFTTLYTFVFGSRLSKKITKIVHPLVMCTAGTWLFAKLFGLLNGFSFPIMLHKYRTGKLTLAGAGAGDILLFLLGPAVVSLACQMYDRRKLIYENFGEVATAVLVSSLGGLFGTAFAVRTLVIGNPAVRLSLLSRNITSPLAMSIASILGGDVSVAVSMVVVTGLIGANFGSAILNALGITDAVARGMGIGAAAHGLGTAAFSNEEDAFPFAAIAMALTASTCTVLVSIPFIKKAILQLALGW